MLPSRGIRATLQSSRRQCSQQPRRLASDSAQHDKSAYHISSGSRTESFGKGFYISISLISLGLVAMNLATSSETKPRFTQFIQSFQQSASEIDRRNAIHQAAAQQAAFDRQLFASATPSQPRIEIRCPESLNRSSPWNVVAGEGAADLTKLMEHYSRENEKAEAARISRIDKEGKITTVYDDTSGGRFPTWVPFVSGSKKVAPADKE